MDNEFKTVLDMMQDFLENKAKQTKDIAMQIITDPLYKSFKASLKAKDVLDHPIFLDFVEKSNEVLKPAFNQKLKFELEHLLHESK